MEVTFLCRESYFSQENVYEYIEKKKNAVCLKVKNKNCDMIQEC